MNSLINDFVFCFKISWESSHFYTVFRVIIKAISPIFTVALAWNFRLILNIFNSYETFDIGFKNIILLSSMYLGLILIQNISSNISSHVETLHQKTINHYIEQLLLSKSLSVNYSLFDNPEFYDNFNLAIDNSDALSSFFWNIFDLVSIIVSFILSFSIIFQLNYFFAILTVLVTIPVAIANLKYIKKVIDLEKQQVKFERYSNYIFEISVIKEYAQLIRIHNLQQYLLDKFYSIRKKILYPYKQLQKRKFKISTVLELPSSIISVIFLIYLAIRVLKNQSGAGDFTFYSSMMQQLMSAILMFMHTISAIADNDERVQYIVSFQQSDDNEVDDDGELVLEKVDCIELDDISFVYPFADECVLENFSYTFEAGKKTAIVGVNGSGKSSLVKLLLRFYEPTKGQILVNGIDIKKYTLNSLRQEFSVYLQNSPNFAFTIEENVVLNDLQGYQKQKINNVLDKCYCNSILAKSKHNLGTYVTKFFDIGGIELSGGEHQRIALARTFFKEQSVMILDEPTSALDPEAEKHILNELNIVSKDKILILISHDLSTVSLADDIIVLEKGSIIETGNVEQLMSYSSRFKELYSYQTRE